MSQTQAEYSETLQAQADSLINSFNLLNRYGQELRLRDSHRGEGMVLLHLTRQTQPVTPSEIAEYANLTSARIATIIKSLEKKAFITRSCDPADQRRILVSATASGRREATQYYALVKDQICKTLAQLTPEDAANYVRILGIIAQNTLLECAPGVAKDTLAKEDPCATC
ncbi:MAG: MarR family transcriptional regulator [Actinomycetaceae bacterium]|nr:MarR family transcriptional regulator [Actinomycetaceae bacterium]